MARRHRLLRALDVYAGIPLVALLGMLRRRRHRPAAPSTIGFLATAAIGDTILLSGIVQDARVSWPESRIVFFAGRDNAGAARLLPGVDEVVVVPATRPWLAARAMRRHAVDLLIDSGQWARFNSALSAVSGAGFTVGFRTPGQRRHFAYDAVADHSAELHEMENFRSLARAAGIATRRPLAIRHVTPVTPERLPASAFAVCHMWSAGTNGWQKEWPDARWAGLIGHLTARGLHVLITGSTEDAPRAAAFCTRMQVDRALVADVAGRFALAELPDVLARSAVVVSVNTGLMHLAAVAGAATVSLDGPTPPCRWGPVGERTRSVSSSLPGCGFLHLGWDYDGHRRDCMEGISVEQVLAAIDSLVPGIGAAAGAGSRHG